MERSMTPEEKKQKMQSRIKSHIGSLSAMMALGEMNLTKEEYQDMCDSCGSVETYLRMILQQINK